MKNALRTLLTWLLLTAAVFAVVFGISAVAHADPAVICGTGQYLNQYTNNCEGYPGLGSYPQQPHYPGEQEWNRTHDRGY